MIVLVKRRNIALLALIVLIALALVSARYVNNKDTLTTSNTKELQRIVLLDAGHGGEDPGAVSDYSGTKEKDINLKIVMKVKSLLESSGYKVLLTREEDVLQYNSDTKNIVQKRKEDLLRRKKMMDEGASNIVVSIHLNKFPETQYYGTQTFYPPNSRESQKLAMCIQKAVREQVDTENKRAALLKKEPIIILKDLKKTTAIVECGFLSNEKEEKLLITEAYQDKLANAIKIGIDQFFGS